MNVTLLLMDGSACGFHVFLRTWKCDILCVTSKVSTVVNLFEEVWPCVRHVNTAL